MILNSIWVGPLAFVAAVFIILSPRIFGYLFGLVVNYFRRCLGLKEI